MPLKGTPLTDENPAGTAARGSAALRPWLVFAAIVASGWLTTLVVPRLGGRALWILPAGIAVAAAIRWGRGQWAPIFAADLVLELLRGRAFLPAVFVAAGLPLGALAAAWLLRRWRFDPGFVRARDPPLYFVASFLAMAVPASIGTLALSSYYPIDPADQLPWGWVDWVRWWLNDVIGALWLGPLLVAVGSPGFAPAERRRGTRTLLAALSLATAAAIVMLPPAFADPGITQLPLVAVSLALVVAASLLLGFVAAAVIVFGLVLIEALSYSFGLGAFRGLAPVQGLVALWSYVGAMIGVSLMIATLVAERRRLEARVSSEARRNRLFLRNAGDGICILDEAGRVVEASDSFCALTGYPRSELLGMHHRAWDPRAPAADAPAADSPTEETRYRRRDGAAIEVAVRSNPFVAEGARYRFVSVRDLSEIRRLEGALLDAIGREQRRLAQDMHDGLGQELTAIAMLVDGMAAQPQARESADRLARLKQLTEYAIRTCRGVAHGLSPVGSDGGLGEALRTMVEAQRGGLGPRVDCEVHGSAPLMVPPQTADHLYRIAQEAVANAVRHAGARRVLVRLEVLPEEVRLEIADDGVGMRPARPSAGGIGLSGMAYRARAIGGELAITEPERGGTRVLCRCPNGANPGAVGLRA